MNWIRGLLDPAFGLDGLCPLMVHPQHGEQGANQNSRQLKKWPNLGKTYLLIEALRAQGSDKSRIVE